MFFWNSLGFSMIQQMLAIWSGFSAFSKSGLNIWKFTVHVLLKPVLENFEHYFTSMWDEYNCVVVWALFGIGFLWDWNENDLFQSCGHCWVFQICWHIECSTFTASSFRIWNCSPGIPSPPLALLIVMLPKTHLTSHSIFLLMVFLHLWTEIVYQFWTILGLYLITYSLIPIISPFLCMNCNFKYVR